MNARPDRDHTLDESLGRALRRAQVPPPGPACLDAETLAAWMDGGLDPGSIKMAETHVSSCARCRAIAGGLARTEPASGVTSETVRSAWRWWLLPLTAAAAAGLLWMIAPEPAPFVAENAPRVEQAHTPAPSQAPTPPIPAEPPPPAAAAGRAAEASRREATEDRTVAAESPAPPPAPAAPRAQALALQQTAGLAVEVVSPVAATRWRALGDGTLEYSSNGGRSWEPIETRVSGAVTAGASPARDVCWLVGSAGLVMLTTDGRTFTRVPAPGAVDLVAVEAVDAQTALVTAADGRRFQTSDGGRTWSIR